MAITFKKLEDDLSTIRLDLNGGSTDANKLGFAIAGDVDMGPITADSTYLTSAVGPDVHQVAVGRGIVQMQFRLVALHTSYANVQTLAQQLAVELDTPGPYEFHPTGEPTRYFDGFAGDIPGLLRGQDLALNKIVQQLLDSDGLPVVLYRLPYLYGPQVLGSGTVVSNDPASSGKRMTVSVSGNAPTRARITMAPESGSTIVQARIGRRSYGDLTTYRQNWYYQAENATAGTDWTTTADGTASGGTRANITFATTTTMVKRARFSISPTDKSGIEGTFRVYARMKPAGLPLTARVQLRWAASSADPVTFTNDETTLTWPSTTTAAWSMVDLGTVSVQRGLGTTYGLTLELWAANDVNTTDLWVDYFALFPLGPTPTTRPDQLLTLAVRGFRDDLGAGPEQWFGKDLLTPTSPGSLTAGAVNGNSLVLNANTEAGGTPANAGFTVPTGRHVVDFDVTITRPSSSVGFEVMGIGVVRRITATAADIVTKNIGFLAGQTKVRDTWTVRFDSVGGIAYQFQVRDTEAVTVNKMTVHKIVHTFIHSLANTLKLRLDGEYGLVAAKTGAFVTDTAGVFQEPLTQQGAFIDLYPGSNELVFDWGDLPPQDADDVDPREPLAQSNLTRAVTVTVDYYPRYTH